MITRSILALGLWLSLAVAPQWAAAQTPLASPAPADTTHKYQKTRPTGTRKPFLQSKGFRAVIIPAVLIGAGASSINDHGFYSSYDAKRDIRRAFGSYRNHLDDYLQFAPYAEIAGVLVAGVESRNDRVNLALVVLKSEVIMLSTVYVMKKLTGIERPDSSHNNAFPSGHTAQAFLAASIVHTEFRDKSQWYGVGAYTIATSVAALRMINNKHWLSDVVAGAGVGILSAHLGYLSHRNRWGRKPIGRDMSIVPVWTPAGGTGLSVTWRPR